MIILRKVDYPDCATYERACRNLSNGMPSAPMSGGMAFFRDETERKKCRTLDNIVRDNGFYIDYGDENDIEEEYS